MAREKTAKLLILVGTLECEDNKKYLVQMLNSGFRGYKNYSDEQLKKALDELIEGDEQLKNRIVKLINISKANAISRN